MVSCSVSAKILLNTPDWVASKGLLYLENMVWNMGFYTGYFCSLGSQ